MRDLVMLDLPAGQAFVDALRTVWDAGDAVFPLDQRLPQTEADRVIAVAQPTAVVGSDGERRSLAGGTPVHDGDAIVVATSGTTGNPKAVMVSHDAIQFTAYSTLTAHACALAGTADTHERVVSYLPLSHIAGNIFISIV